MKGASCWSQTRTTMPRPRRARRGSGGGRASPSVGIWHTWILILTTSRSSPSAHRHHMPTPNRRRSRLRLLLLTTSSRLSPSRRIHLRPRGLSRSTTAGIQSETKTRDRPDQFRLQCTVATTLSRSHHERLRMMCLMTPIPMISLIYGRNESRPGTAS